MGILRTELITETFICSDGTAFVNEQEAIAHEKDWENRDLYEKCENKLFMPRPETPFPIAPIDPDEDSSDYRYYLIRSDEDLELFRRANECWFPNIYDMPELSVERMNFPEIIVILADLHKVKEPCIAVWSQFMSEVEKLDKQLQEEVSIKTNTFPDTKDVDAEEEEETIQSVFDCCHEDAKYLRDKLKEISHFAIDYDEDDDCGAIVKSIYMKSFRDRTIEVTNKSGTITASLFCSPKEEGYYNNRCIMAIDISYGSTDKQTFEHIVDKVKALIEYNKACGYCNF